MNIIEELKEVEAEIYNIQERLKEVCNPKNGVKFVISGILSSLEEARKGIEFFIKMLENLESIQHTDTSKLVISEET